jgi:hypothetical protein
MRHRGPCSTSEPIDHECLTASWHSDPAVTTRRCGSSACEGCLNGLIPPISTALASLISEDPKDRREILGHSPQTFMHYVRANDDTARGAIEKMSEGLPQLPNRLRLLNALVAARGSGRQVLSTSFG